MITLFFILTLLTGISSIVGLPSPDHGLPHPTPSTAPRRPKLGLKIGGTLGGGVVKPIRQVVPAANTGGKSREHRAWAIETALKLGELNRPGERSAKTAAGEARAAEANAGYLGRLSTRRASWDGAGPVSQPSSSSSLPADLQKDMEVNEVYGPPQRRPSWDGAGPKPKPKPPQIQLNGEQVTRGPQQTRDTNTPPDKKHGLQVPKFVQTAPVSLTPG